MSEPVAGGLFDDGGLVGGECGRCRRRHFPLTTSCPWCGADAVSSVNLSTSGSLWAWTSVNAPPPGYEGRVPYGFGVVELADDGLRVITRLTETQPARLALGMAMRFVVVELSPGKSTWAFEAVEAGA